jgi:formylglycine-generating enzyme required for sulfatase activity
LARLLSLFAHYEFSNDKLPVESVSWDDANTFIWWMNFFGRHHDYGLPSEAEWEYAARAGTKTPFYWGERAEDGCDYENAAGCRTSAGSTAAVGSYKPNPWGLHDMLGNVWQWVEDCYVNNYDVAPRDGNAITIKDCNSRVVRGGSWYDLPRGLRAANRVVSSPDDRVDDFGFRVARTVAP